MTLFRPLIRTALGLTLALAAVTVRAETPSALVLTLADGKADPVSLVVPAQVNFILIVRNTGTTPAEFESHRLHIEKIVAPGAELRLPLLLPVGDYPFVDDFHGTAKGVITAK